MGLLIGTLIGTVLGLSLWFSESAAFIAKPFVTALGALPVFALAPLMIVWFGVGFGMKVAIAVFWLYRTCHVKLLTTYACKACIVKL